MKGTATRDTKIKLLVFSDGERSSILLDQNGMPLFDATVWSLTVFRARSASTVEQAQRGAMLIHLFCSHLQIDLPARVRAGSFFSEAEVEALMMLAVQPFEKIREIIATVQERKSTRRTATRAKRLTFLRRLPTTAKLTTVGASTTANRLHYGRKYIHWLGMREKSRLASSIISANEAFAVSHEYETRLNAALDLIRIREPEVPASGTTSLPSAAVERLLAVADPVNEENPWADQFVRLRNWTIINWLLGTGMRRGELLGLSVADFNRGQGYCEIRRRQDDKKDPRSIQPNAKTLERFAPLDEALTSLGERYLEARLRIQPSRRHRFLFVTSSGAPLSLSSITNMFATLRRKFPEVGPVTAHVLRHQWNENYSIYADSIGLKPDEEARERAWLMGWSEKSIMPGYYLKRRTRAKADEHSKAMQRRLVKHQVELTNRMIAGE